jgi:hypothetical protein
MRHGDVPIVRTVPLGGHSCDRPKPQPLTPREQLLAGMSEAVQEVYWCIDLAGQAGLSDDELCEMLVPAVVDPRCRQRCTCLPRPYRAARSRLEALGLIARMPLADELDNPLRV